ncbi:MAG: TetR/AcrR family transcriptional regulator [Blautia sp.]|jgi:AcrR family transcriptional regulator
MGIRQKEKSEMTHQELKNAALTLFLEKGYKNTSIQDIAIASGYSIGSFYNHYQTKKDVLAEIWNEHAVKAINQATETLNHLTTPEDLANYLIDNSNSFDLDEITVRLAQAAQEANITVGRHYLEVKDASHSYMAQIILLLKTFCPHTEEAILMSHASLLDAIQYSHSKVTRDKVGYVFDDEDLKHNLLILLHQWVEEDKQIG